MCFFSQCWFSAVVIPVVIVFDPTALLSVQWVKVDGEHEHINKKLKECQGILRK